MSCGHDPRAIDEYPAIDVEQFVSLLPLIWQLRHPLGEVD